MFGRKSKKAMASEQFAAPPYEGSRDFYRERMERIKAECRADDAEAKARALSYVPPVKVVRGEAGRFIEIGSFEGGAVTVPASFIAGVKIHPIERQLWRRDSARHRVSIAMMSGFEQSVWVESACADMLLAAINQAWTGAAR